ncbi:hypothetical protein KAS42_03475, partial [bacterium]|nr:hypothetical protein [bacterium]
MDKVGYKKLFVWKKTDELAYQIRNFPKSALIITLALIVFFAGAQKAFSDVTYNTGNYSGIYSDSGNITIATNAVITLTGDVTFTGTGGTSAFIMNSGSSIVTDGNTRALSINAAAASTLRTINIDGTFTTGRWANVPTFTTNNTITCGDFIKSSGSGETFLGNDLNCANLNLNGSSSITVSGSPTITVTGNWANGGTYTNDSEEVVLSGAGTATFTGSTTFHNLTCTTAGKTLTFTDGTTQTIESGGVLTLTGDSGNLITLHGSSTAGWTLTDSGTESVSYVDVAYGTATNGITAATSKDSGNTVNWTFSASTVTWDGSTDTDWDTAANWDLGYVPNDTDNVVIANVASDPVLGNATVTNNLTINSGAILSLDGNNLTVNGTYANNSGTLMLNGDETTVSLTNDTDSGTTKFVKSTGTITIKNIFPCWDAEFDSDSAGDGDAVFNLPSGAITVNNDLTITDGTVSASDGDNVSITAETITHSGGAISGVTGDSITLITDSIALTAGNDTVSTTGAIVLKPITQARTKGIGGTVPAGNFNLIASEIAALTGYSSLTIGASGDSLAVDIDNVTFEANTTIYGGAMALETITATSLNVTLTATGTITQTGAITAASLTVTTKKAGGAGITLTNASNDVDTVTLYSYEADGSTPANTTISFTDADGVDIAGIETVGNVTLTTGSAVTQSGAIIANQLMVTSGATINLTNASNDVNALQFSGSAISFTDADGVFIINISTAGTFTLIAGGAINQGGGSILANTLVLTNTSGSTTLTQGNAISVLGAINCGGNTFTLRDNIATGITQTGVMTAASLVLTNTSGTTTLTQDNVVTSLGAISCAGQSFSIKNTQALAQSGVVTTETFAANLTNGALNLDTQTNAITNLGAVTAPSGFSLTNGISLTLQDTVNTTNNAVSIDVGTGTALDTNDQSITTGNGTITLIADSIDLGATADQIITTGAIILKPKTQARTKGIGGATPAGNFNLIASEIAALTNYSSLTIGASGDSLAVDIDAVTFEDSTSIYGGATNIDDNISVTGGNLNLNSGSSTITQNAGTISTTTSGDITLTSEGSSTLQAITSAGALTLAKTSNPATYTVGAYIIDVVGNLTINSGVTLTCSGATTINMEGNWDNNGTFTAAASTITFDGLANATFEAGAASTYNNIQINKTDTDANDNVTFQTDAVTIDGALTITDGELIQQVALTTGTVTLSDASSKWANVTDNANVTLSGAVANTGTITFNPPISDLIQIRSLPDGTQYNWQGGGAFNMTDVNVKDQTCIGGTPANITVTSGTNSGNNINWVFGASTVSGTVYNSIGGANVGAGVTVTVAIYDTSTGVRSHYTDDTDGSGVYTITDGTIDTGDVIVAYLDGLANEASAVTKANSNGASISDLHLYYNAVDVRDEGGGIANSDLAHIDSGIDDDIKYTVAGGNLTVTSGFALYINTGDTFAPGGNVLVQGTGDLQVETGAILNMAGNDLTVSDDIINDGTISQTASGATILNGATKTISGTPTSTTFYNLTVAGTYTLQQTVTISGTTTVNVTKSLAVAGITLNANTINNSGTITLDATSATTTISLDNTAIFTNSSVIQVTNSSNTCTIQADVAGTATFTGTDIDYNGNRITLSRLTYNPAVSLGEGGTVNERITLGDAVTFAGTITINGLNATGPLYTGIAIGINTLTAQGTITNTKGYIPIFAGGSIAAGANAIDNQATGYIYNSGSIICGNFTNTGTYGNTAVNTITSSGDVVISSFGGTTTNNTLTMSGASKTINASVTIGNLTISAGTTLPLTNILTLNGNLAINGGATFDNSTANLDINVGGNWVNSGDYKKGTETVTLNGTSGTQAITSNSKSFNKLTINNSGVSVQLIDAITLSNKFYLQAGAFDCNSQSQNFAGDFQIDGGTTYTKGGTLTFNAGTSQSFTDSATQNIGTVVITDASTNLNMSSKLTSDSISVQSSGTLTTGANNLDVGTGGITISAGTTLNGTNSIITCEGNWDNNGTFTASASTITFDGLASATFEAGAASTYNNIQINKTDTDANDNVTFQTDAVTIDGALTITDGELIQQVAL